MIMTFHFVNQYGNSKAVPIMLLDDQMKPQGTFWFFTAVTLLGLVFTYYFLPETAGKSLEGMDEMFNLPWYLIGRKGRQLTEGSGSVAEALARGDTEKMAHIEQSELAEHVENAQSGQAK